MALIHTKTTSVDEFSTAFPAPYSFALGQCSPFPGDPPEVHGLSLEVKCHRGSQTHQVSRDSSGDQGVRAIHQGTTDKQHHCSKLKKKKGKCELHEKLFTVTTGDITAYGSQTA